MKTFIITLLLLTLPGNVVANTNQRARRTTTMRQPKSLKKRSPDIPSDILLAKKSAIISGHIAIFAEDLSGLFNAPGAVVKLLSQDFSSKDTPPVVVATQITDEQGKFTFGSVTLQDNLYYSLELSYKHSISIPIVADLGEAGSAIDSLDLAFDETGTPLTEIGINFDGNLSQLNNLEIISIPVFVIKGHITDGTGRGVRDVAVTLSGPVTSTTFTDDTGEYFLLALDIAPFDKTYTVAPSELSLIFTPSKTVLENLSRDQTVDFIADVNPNPSSEDLVDDFQSEQRDTDKNNLGTLSEDTAQGDPFDPNITVKQGGGRLVITPQSNVDKLQFNGYTSVRAFDLTEGTASVGVSQIARNGGQTIFAVGSDSEDFYRFMVDSRGATPITVKAYNLHTERAVPLDGTTPLLVFQVKNNGQTTSFSVPYDRVQHRYWRFRNDPAQTNDTPNGSIVFETSPDQAIWKEQFRKGIEKPITALATELSAGTTTKISDPGAAAFDNFKLHPTVIDEASYFVSQQYRDFLNRQADISGLQYWVNEVFICGEDEKCIDNKRQNVSAAFFVSTEFQQTGFLVYKLYKAGFGTIPNKPVPVKFAAFLPDVQSIGSGVIVGQPGYEQKLEQNKQAFINAFVNRSAFKAQNPDTLTAAQFVDALNANAGGSLSTTERNALVNGLAAGTETRAMVLRKVAENQALTKQEFNRAFVLMQYFGYLRRDPDSGPDSDFGGYNFWLNKLNSFNGDYIRSEMVRSFILSEEYRKRFIKS